MGDAHPYTPTRGGGGQAPHPSWGFIASCRCVQIVIAAAAICVFFVHATLVDNVRI
jgi:hypothetical protein